MRYDLSKLTEITQSGWTMDFYLDNDLAAEWNNGSNLVCDGWRDDQKLYNALTELVSTWQRTETEDGGVITYTKPEATTP